jgi:hypothetical protein
MLWQDLTTEQIIGGKTPDGVRYLKLFLADYSRTFNVDNLCGSCNNLIAEYHKKYTIKMKAKDNTCQYRLLDKYNGIALEPCSNVRVNNGNITDELGAQLMANKGARIFAKFPTQTEEETIVQPTAEAGKPKRKRRIKKQ